MASSSGSRARRVEPARNTFHDTDHDDTDLGGPLVLHIAWSATAQPAGEQLGGEAQSGMATLEPGAAFILARRMNLSSRQPVVVETIAGSTYMFVRLPYVSDPALVITATAGQPVVHRGQRDNGAVVELSTPFGASTTPAPGQKISVTHSGSRVELRFPDLLFSAEMTYDTSPAAVPDSGTVQLDLDTLQVNDAWLVGAIAVALSPDHGVVAHAELKDAFARWRGTEVPSDGGFDRNVLRPAIESRGLEMPGPRFNKIVYLVERCRRTSEFPATLLDDVRERLAGPGA